MPSAPQKRACANGRSLDTHSTDTPPAAALSLNLRTLVAHTGVSTDGKMFSSTGLPANCSLLSAPRSDPVRVNAGALAPTAGRSPTVLIVFPRKVICAMRTVCQARHIAIGAGLAINEHGLKPCGLPCEQGAPLYMVYGCLGSIDATQ